MIAEHDTVWISAVPLPLLGWRTDRCACGAKFRGKGRKHAYEIHYRRVHHREDLPEDYPQIEISRAEATALYAEVNADSPGDRPETLS